MIKTKNIAKKKKTEKKIPNKKNTINQNSKKFTIKKIIYLLLETQNALTFLNEEKKHEK